MDTVIFLKHLMLNTATPELTHWAQSQLPTGTHQARQDSFLLSRIALKIALEKNHISPAPSHLTLAHHHELTSYPQIYASLSHTKDAAVAWVRNQKGFGIDIERLDRVIKEAVWERVHNPQDSKNLTRLELWCLKEAVFKTLSNANLISGPIPFADIQFSENGEWTWHQVKGHYRSTIFEQEWQCAQAWL